MATNYAEKYSGAVDERFQQAALTNVAVNQDYDWEGVQTVNVYSVGTAPMHDYEMSGLQRYGNPDELGTSTQAMTLEQDRSFTFTVDRRNYTNQMMVTASGRALRRQLDEVVIPEVDRYRLSVLAAEAGNTSGAIPITQNNAYESFLEGVATLKDNKAPTGGTFAYIGSNFYKNIRRDGSFIQASDMAQQMLVTGQVGLVENVPLIFVPVSYFPPGVEFLITNRIAAPGPVKLSEYKIHDNPQGVNGWLVEGRLYYDTFVLDNKANVIYVHRAA